MFSNYNDAKLGVVTFSHLKTRDEKLIIDRKAQMGCNRGHQTAQRPEVAKHPVKMLAARNRTTTLNADISLKSTGVGIAVCRDWQARTGETPADGCIPEIS